MLEDQHKDENVVHAQRILDEVTGEKIEPVMWPFDVPDQGIERQRHEHPDDGPLESSAHA